MSSVTDTETEDGAKGRSAHTAAAAAGPAEDLNCPFTMMMKVLEEKEKREADSIIIPTEPKPQTANIGLLAQQQRAKTKEMARSNDAKKSNVDMTNTSHGSSNSSGLGSLFHHLPSPRAEDFDEWPEDLPPLMMTRRGSLQNAVIVEGAPLTQELLDEGIEPSSSSFSRDARDSAGNAAPNSPPALVRRANSFAGHGHSSMMPVFVEPLPNDKNLNEGSHPGVQSTEQRCPFSGMSSAAPQMRRNSFTAASQGTSSTKGDPVLVSSTGGSVMRKTGSDTSRGSKSKSRGSVRPSKAKTRSSGYTNGSKGRMTSASRSRKPKKRVATEVIYSSWEAETYAPSIRESWRQVLEVRSMFEIGGIFYDQLFVDIPEIQHMFGSSREVQAAKFAEMLHAIVASVDSEAHLYSKLRALAPMHVEKGVHAEHMPRMGEVLMSVLQTILGPLFDRAVRAAWEWLWAWLSKVMQQTLEEVRFGSNAITRSWNMAQDNHPDHEVGEVFFDTLFQFAPNLKSVYYKPRQILSGKFVEMISTLVSYSGDKTRMHEQITWLGIRHVAYNAQAQHVKVLGDVLVKTMETCVGPSWTEEMCTEWRKLWECACEALFGVMEDAQRYGTTLSSIWQIVEHKTTAPHFGATLKRKLLSGTEWVATLNRRIKESDATPVLTWKKQKEANGAASSRDDVSIEGLGVSALASSTASGAGPGRRANGEEKEASVLSPGMAPLATEQRAGKQRAGPHQGLGGEQSPSTRHRAGSLSLEEVASRRPSQAGSHGWPALFLRQPSAATFAKHNLRNSGVPAEDLGPLPQEKGSESDAIGQQFWEFLKQSITMLWQPERQSEEIIVRAHSMFRWGIRSSQLDTIGDALERTVALYVSEAGASWGEHEADAWSWFWGIAHRALQRTLDVCERDEARIVAESWELAKQLVPAEELGDSFFQNLARIAPYIVPLFRRPKRIQAAQFVEAVDLLVSFGINPAEFFHGFRGLVIRHIKYGVKAEYTKPFGQAILLGIQNALGEHWTEEVASSWNDLWLRVSSCVSRSLNVGTNILVVALVQGDVEKLEQAARCAPRQDRHNWMTKVDVNGEELSPLAWAMRDGKFNLVEFMLQDLLQIRADRDAYYYGREVLFTAHPDIVDLVCRECPFLIDTLLDGLLWHSQFVDLDGVVRVNYYLENIYGDPAIYPDAWTSSLAVLVQHGVPNNFIHPLIAKVLDLKWHNFCRRIFLLMQAWYIVLLALLMVGNIFHVGNCDYQPVRICLAVTSTATALVQTVFMAVQVLNQQTTVVKIWHRAHITLPVWLCSSWNIQRYISCVLLPFAALLEPCHLQHYYADGEARQAHFHAISLHDCDSITLAGRAFSAFTALLLWTQAMQIFVVSTRLAALSWSLGVMFQDVSRNLVVVGIFILAWTSALTALQETNFEDFEYGLVNLCRQVLSLSPPDNGEMHPLSAFFLFSFVVATNIGMMAILIAQIRSSYEAVAKNKVGFAMQHRAHICVDIESTLPLSYRQKLFASFNFGEPLPFDQGDLGPPGGIQVKELAHIRKHDKYIPDRILRYTGVSSPTDPWEEEESNSECHTDEEDC